MAVELPKVIRQALAEQDPALLPGFSEWADTLRGYTVQSAATSDLIAHRIGMAGPERIGGWVMQ